MGYFTLESASTDILSIGLCTVDLLFAVPNIPQFDHSTRASQFLRQGGGPAATALVTFARLAPGARGAFIGKVGDDENSDFIRNGLDQEEIDIVYFAVAKSAQSRVALVLMEESSGERGFVTRTESCGELAPSELRKETVSSAHIVHLDDADGHLYSKRPSGHARQVAPLSLTGRGCTKTSKPSCRESTCSSCPNRWCTAGCPNCPLQTS